MSYSHCSPSTRFRIPATDFPRGVLLCIAFHCTGNLFVISAPAVGYLIGMR
jgi:hypothetical protein